MKQRTINCSEVACVIGKHRYRSIQGELQKVVNRNETNKTPIKKPLTLESVGLSIDAPDIQDKIDSLSLNKYSKGSLKQQLRQQIGLQEEDRILRLYESQSKKEVKQDSTLRQKQILDGWILQGCIDGMIDDKTIVECKNRASHWFDYMPLYERVQCFTYMWLFDKKECIMIEKVGRGNDEIRTKTVKWDQDEWDEITELIKRFTEIYNKINNKSKEFKDNFFDKSNASKANELLLNKLNETSI